MPRYEYSCSKGHVTEMVRGVSECTLPGPSCKCGLDTERKFSVPEFIMFVTIQESFEWADRIMAGTETMTADFEPEPERKANH